MPQNKKITAPAKMAADTDFADRALIAALQEAIAVLREPDTTPNHAFRVGYAQSILKSPLSYQPTVAWVLAAAFGLDDTYSGATPGDIPDDAMTVVFRAMWDALSQP